MQLAGALTGSHSVKKSGGGTLLFASHGGGFSGSFEVTTGTLAISGNYSSVPAITLSGAFLEGSGTIGAVAGAGTVSPGPGAAILTAASSSARHYAFLFSQNSPDFATPANSHNDLLRLTSPVPFPAPLTSDSQIAIYLDVPAVESGDVFLGGFFSDLPADFKDSIDQAAWNVYIASALGTVEHEDKAYAPLPDSQTAAIDTIPHTANFGAGPVSGRILRLRLGSSASFAAWQTAHFTPGELNDPAISGPNADPSGAGVPNLVRFAFGMSLDDSPDDFAPALRQVGDDFEYSFPMIPGADVIYRVFASATVEQTGAVIFDSATSPPLPIEAGRARLLLPKENGFNDLARFLRLGVALID